MICRAPDATAPRMEQRPTPPKPTTATEEPGDTFAVLTTAPTPVSTAQPKRALYSKGRGALSFTQDSCETTAYSAKADTPIWWCTGSHEMESRLSPRSRLPAPLAFAAGSHRAGRPVAQGMQPPQLGTKTSTTWSPRARPVTPSPTASTVPEASWPSTMGVGRGRS